MVLIPGTYREKSSDGMKVTEAGEELGDPGGSNHKGPKKYKRKAEEGRRKQDGSRVREPGWCGL